MNSSLFVPNKINVGFQAREGTYTGKLAYVIYFDNKGKLRKETSWQSWRHKDIPNQEYDNEPISGFVLNKGVGGQRESWGWNARNEYIRVYDPRDFEFEISVANLLFILQETSSIKGKGLEGEFVYAWDGKELVLLPVGSKEYESSVTHTKLQTKKVTAKEITPGCCYLNKDGKEVMYMGRVNLLGNLAKSEQKQNKKHVFLYLDKINEDNEYRDALCSNTGSSYNIGNYWIQSGFTKLARKLGDEINPLYADEYDKLVSSPYVSTPISFIEEKEEIDWNNSDCQHYFYKNIFYKKFDTYYSATVRKENCRDLDEVRDIDEPLYYVEDNKVWSFEDGKIQSRYVWSAEKGIQKNLTRLDVDKMAIKLYAKCENGSKFKIKN